MSSRSAIVIVFAASVSCHKEPPPEPADPLVVGGACHPQSPRCANKDTGLVCIGAVWHRLPCSDACKDLTPEQMEGDRSPCTPPAHVRVGDGCIYPSRRGMPREGDTMACSEDEREVLACRSPGNRDGAGIFATSATCAPNEHCVSTRNGASCVAR
jgi:hypothetical protein